MKNRLKLFFSLLLLTSNNYASAPFVISYSKAIETALLVQEILMNEQGIPENLIELKWQVPACLEINAQVMHLCIDDSNELNAVMVNHHRIEKSYRIFSQIVKETQISEFHESDQLVEKGVTK